jgi:uncharacterized Zn-finger protein
MSFGNNIQVFINYISENQLETFHFEDNILQCNKTHFVKTWNKHFESNLRWSSILRNFGYYGIRFKENKIFFPEHFCLEQKFLRKNHKPRQTYTCDVPGCNYSVKNKTNLIKHLLRHSNKSYLPCEIPECGYIAKRSDHLTAHMLRHISERNYKCNHPKCNFSSTVKGSLTVHMRTHTYERPYPCTVVDCDYSAAESSSLKKHMLTHTGERPHPCTISECNYSAAQISTLNKHMKTHIIKEEEKEEKEETTTYLEQSSDDESVIELESDYVNLFNIHNFESKLEKELYL